MAKLVHLSVVPHDPTLPAAAAGLRPNVSPDTKRVLDGITRLPERFLADRPLTKEEHRQLLTRDSGALLASARTRSCPTPSGSRSRAGGASR